MAWPPTIHQDVQDAVTGLMTASADRQLVIRPVTGNYTVVDADTDNRMLHCTATTAVTITLPSGVTTEMAIPWRQWGTGLITFAAGSGMTVVSRGGATKSAGQYASGVVTCVDASTWLLEGDIST